jgi:NADH-quinone oxidoreductase subunit L
MTESQVLLAAKLILILPLAAFVIQVLVPLRWRNFRERQGDWIPTLAMGLACLAAWAIFYTQVIARPNGIRVPIHAPVEMGDQPSDASVLASVVRSFRSLDWKHLKDAKGRPCLDAEELGGALLAEADLEKDGLLSDQELYSWRLKERNEKRPWLTIGDPLPIDQPSFRGKLAWLRFDFGFLIDNMTAIMLVVVTTVSLLVHVYSMGYMRDHHGHPAPRYGRFFAFLGLFTFSMLGLVLTDNLFMLFMFWELVGVCSYFLIGFEFERPAAQVAQIKAFMTTRVGDLGFFLAIMIIGAHVGSFRFDDIFASVAQHQWHGWVLSATAILLFIGPVGKSAQFPLHVWLPDAMEGPTPVSALIHAATMVAAGVYLVARMFPFFAGPDFFTGVGTYFDSVPLTVVAFTGGFTAIFAATIALVQNDIKKVLAYSTISQLGYMVLGIGVGSFSAGMFHLWTHAFFKALLFLGSGSVIHAVGTNDMREMGGLRRKMPITYITFLIATMAISGVPFLSGFYSKEAILTQALAFGLYRGHLFILPFAMGMLTAGLTAFYMFRIIFLTFTGEPRNQARHDHAHESPMSMWVPLAVLCAFTVLSAGAFGIASSSEWFHRRVSNEMPARILQTDHPAVLASMPLTQTFEAERESHEEPREAVIGAPEPAEHAEAPGYIVWPAGLDEEGRERAHLIPFLLSLIAATLGISFCYSLFVGSLQEEDLAPRGTWLGAYKRVLEKLYYLDDLYNWAFVKPLMSVRLSLAWFDRNVIDRVVDWFSEATIWTSQLSEKLDRRSLGMARGAQLAALAMAFASLALLVSLRSDPEHYASLRLGPLGALSIHRGVLTGIGSCVLPVLIAAFAMSLSGVTRAASAAVSALLAVSSIVGAELGIRIARWTGGIESQSWGFHRLSIHPAAAAFALVLGFGAVVMWWAGLGVDGSVRWLSEKLVLGLGSLARRMQTGRLQEYLFATVVGIVAIIFIVAIV